MITINCDEKLRYHAYHILTLYYSISDVVFSEDEEVVDISIGLDGKGLCINFFGAEHVYEFMDMNTLRRELFLLLREKTGKILPWGILIGIRPSKIVLKYIHEGLTREEIVTKMKDEFLAMEEKISLAYEVALRERDLLMKVDKENSVDIYVGMPFCPSRCLYCSFASNVYQGNRYKDDYLRLLQVEIKMISGHLKRHHLEVGNVYFGGGTPTAVNDEEFEEVMKAIFESFIRGRDTVEFTVEAGRVDSIDEKKLETMKRYEVTRISINPQTMSDATLRLIGRNHDSRMVREKFLLARDMGFNNINMDIILGLPGEVVKDVLYTLDGLRELSPENITVHGLTLKRASRLYEDFVLNKKYDLPSQADMNLMYSLTDAMARDIGLVPYYMYRQKNMVGNLENVGYSKEGFENLYNITMIEEVKTIIALGADGVSKKVNGKKIERFANFKGLNDYTERFQEMMENKLNFLED